MNTKNNGGDPSDNPAYNLLHVIRVLYQWRRPVIGLCLLVGLLTAAISLFMPNYYNSTTVFLAASPDQAKPEIMFNKTGVKSFVYGTENDIDRILTVAESGELINFLIDKFNLYEHYKIDSSQKKAPFKVKKKFLKYYDVIKTSKDAIELSFEDKDPAFAATVANAARQKIDGIAQNLLKARFQKSIATFNRNLTYKRQQLDFLADTLKVLRSKYKIYNSNSQSETMTVQYDLVKSKYVRQVGRLAALRETKGIPRDTIRMLEATIKGLKNEVDTLDQKMNMLNAGLSIVNLYEKQYLEANQSYSDDQERLKEYQAAFHAQIPALIVIEEGEAPVMKSRPKRSIIVIAAGLATFIFAVFGVLLFDAYKDIDWKVVLDGNSHS